MSTTEFDTHGSYFPNRQSAIYLAFLGRGVLRMERDSVIHSTISSAASAWLRQNSMASAMSPLLGDKPRSISSSLSRSLQRWRAVKSKIDPTPGSPNSKAFYQIGEPWDDTVYEYIFNWIYAKIHKEMVLLFLQAAFLAGVLLFLLFLTIIIRTVEVWIKRRRTPQRAILKHPKVLCSPFAWSFTLSK